MSNRDYSIVNKALILLLLALCGCTRNDGAPISESPLTVGSPLDPQMSIVPGALESAVATPKPSRQDEIPWTEAEALILEGEVQQVVQLHSLEVTLVLRNGMGVKTTEPTIDEVFRVIERCGDACSDMVLATE
jgi:hypothetical protein